MNLTPPAIMPVLGATSIVGYNLATSGDPDVQGIVTSRLRHPRVHTWPRLSLHIPAQVADWCASLPTGSIVLYCDAVCDVSKCEQNPAWAEEINIGNLQRMLDHLPSHTRLVYVSSDHVFGHDGIYDESAAPCPVSRYGAIRARAEQLALTRPGSLLIRAGLPIGPSLDGKSGHVDWLNYRLKRDLPVTIVTDESRSAVPTPLLARRILALARSSITGTRHITATRQVTRVELATILKDHFDLPGQLSFATRAQQPAPHLGRIQLATRYKDPLAEPLPSPLDLLQQEAIV